MTTGSFLDKILPAVRARLAERQARRSIEDLRVEAARRPPALDFAGALKPVDGGVRAIAEIKRASPSKGVLRADLDPQAFAEKYVRWGAAAISVLTEQDFFQGSLSDLRAVKQSAVARGVPVLRKDFIVDPYQIVEARAAGADSVLLIAALLSDPALAAFIGQARDLGMEPLVETHDAEETRRAVVACARVVGVNARDLRTFEVDITLLTHLRPLIPADRVVVAESGIASMADVARLRGYGADAILVGESLVREKDPVTLDDLIRLPTVVRRVTPRLWPAVKLCGMRTPADALAAYEAGADLIGMVFAPGKRQVTIETAREIVRALPSDALTVGVFTDQDDERVIQPTAYQTGISFIQTPAHRPGDISMISTTSPRHGTPRSWLARARGLALIDSAPPGVWGGSGQTGDWSIAAQWASVAPILLAGGLTPENVGDAIRVARPWGVDVSSGIEGPGGQKDPARMRAFVAAVRETGDRNTKNAN